MISEDELLEVVFRLGKMKYTPERICTFLGLDTKKTSEFIVRFSRSDDPVRIRYEQGLAIGDYRIDRGLEKAGIKGNPVAISELNLRQYHRRMDELKKELFGI